MAQFKINNTDDKAMGVIFLEGTYDELLKLPKVKDTLINNWADEHGAERDLIGRVYESRMLNIPIYLHGDTIADFLAKRLAFNAIMLAGAFNLKAIELNRQYDLVYSDTTNYKGGNNWCSFTLVAFDDKPQLNIPIQ